MISGSSVSRWFPPDGLPVGWPAGRPRRRTAGLMCGAGLELGSLRPAVAVISQRTPVQHVTPPPGSAAAGAVPNLRHRRSATVYNVLAGVYRRCSFGVLFCFQENITLLLTFEYFGTRCGAFLSRIREEAVVFHQGSHRRVVLSLEN